MEKNQTVTQIENGLNSDKLPINCSTQEKIFIPYTFYYYIY